MNARNLIICVCLLSAARCGRGYTIAIDPGASPTPTSCVATETSETRCADTADNDCDGYTDCLDPDCSGKLCAAAAGYACTSGACIRGADDGLVPLPGIDNVRVRVRGDTAIVEFEPVAGARDYRIYPRPLSADVSVATDGVITVRNAIYRCAGDLPRDERSALQYYPYERSIAGEFAGYSRTAAESVLGHVYLTPGADRQPVFRLSVPNGAWNFGVAPYSEFNSADYVAGVAARDAGTARGLRDDGVAFYVPIAGDRAVYRARFNADASSPTSRVTAFYVDGAEATARNAIATPEDRGERFRVWSTAREGTVALHRVLGANYTGNEWFDHLAPGEERYQRTLQQGNRAVPSLTWSGLRGDTTLVIEALDVGCPFPGGYIAAHGAPASDQGEQPSISLEEARLPSTEVFVNGQHDSRNRPRPIARSYVTVSPQAQEHMSWRATFDPGSTWEPLERVHENNGHFLYRNARWAIDFAGCTENVTLGPLLGQFAFGFGDWGSSCAMSMVPRDVTPLLRRDRFLHVRMATDIPSTMRRYPQIVLTTLPVVAPLSRGPNRTALHARLADSTFASQASTIIVQPFGTNHEVQIQLCHRRPWGVSGPCPRAAIYGPELGVDTPAAHWLPVPLAGDRVGFDRPVLFDVYASTQRVYVMMDGLPAACAALPPDSVPEGPITVAFGAVLFHSAIDEGVTGDNGLAPHAYLRRFSLTHTDRRFDDLAINVDVDAPAWDESRMPCVARFDGGAL